MSFYGRLPHKSPAGNKFPVNPVTSSVSLFKNYLYSFQPEDRPEIREHSGMMSGDVSAVCIQDPHAQHLSLSI